MTPLPEGIILACWKTLNSYIALLSTDDRSDYLPGHIEKANAYSSVGRGDVGVPHRRYKVYLIKKYKS